MNKIVLRLLVVVSVFLNVFCYGQRASDGFDRGAIDIPCVSPEDRAVYQGIVALNQNGLELQSRRQFKLNRGSDPGTCIWPIAQVDDTYHITWAISNYLDHNPVIGELSDWNCGEQPMTLPQIITIQVLTYLLDHFGVETYG